MGLANRLVPSGSARSQAEALAREIAAFPQAVMRSDRQAAIDQWAHSAGVALDREFRSGLAAMSEEGTRGPQAFANGAGRHGRFHEES